MYYAGVHVEFIITRNVAHFYKCAARHDIYIYILESETKAISIILYTID